MYNWADILAFRALVSESPHEGAYGACNEGVIPATARCQMLAPVAERGSNRSGLDGVGLTNAWYHDNEPYGEFIFTVRPSV
jgi:hypothetical protein